MKIKLKSGEDLVVVTKSGGEIVVPDNTSQTSKTLATEDLSEITSPDGSTSVSAVNGGTGAISSNFQVEYTRNGVLHTFGWVPSNPPYSQSDGDDTLFIENGHTREEYNESQTQVLGASVFDYNSSRYCRISQGASTLATYLITFVNGVFERTSGNEHLIVRDASARTKTIATVDQLPVLNGPFNARNLPFGSDTIAFTSYGLEEICTSDGNYNNWFNKLPKNNGTLALQDGLAPSFSDSDTYVVGAYCTHEGLLYECTTAVTVAGSWTGSTNWSEVKVSGILGNVSAALDAILGN